MRTIIALAFVLLALTPCLAIQAKKPSYATIKKIEAMKNQKNSWSSIMINMAQLQAQAGGPVDDLVDALAKLLEDLGVKLDEAYAEYDRRTAEHQEEVKRLNELIAKAQSDIAATETFLRDVLYVQKATLETDIANLKTSIQNTKLYITDITNERELAHNNYLVRVQEHNDAIAAIDECLNLLKTLAVDNFNASLAQVKKFQNSLTKVQNKVKVGKNIDRSLVKALLSLASSQFTNQDALKKVGLLMEQVKENLETSLVTEAKEEEDAQTSFEAEVAQKTAEINSMTIEVGEKQEQLALTEQQIADNEAFLEQRKYDLTQLEGDLKAENEAFDRITEAFNDLVAQFQKEIDACNEALNVLNSAEFAGYISERIGKYEGDVVIDQAHGQGIETANWSV